MVLLLISRLCFFRSGNQQLGIGISLEILSCAAFRMIYYLSLLANDSVLTHLFTDSGAHPLRHRLGISRKEEKNVSGKNFLRSAHF
jgi:hypothetical protein